MKLTQEDIQKYGTEEEKKLLKEYKFDGSHWQTENIQELLSSVAGHLNMGTKLLAEVEKFMK